MPERISLEGKLGIGLALIIALGAGAAVMWPDQRWIGLVTMAAATVGLVLLAAHGRWAKITSGTDGASPHGMISLVGMTICAIGFIAFGTAHVWPRPKAAAPVQMPTPARVADQAPTPAPSPAVHHHKPTAPEPELPRLEEQSSPAQPIAAPEEKRASEQPPVRDTYTNNGNNYGIMGPVTLGKSSFELTDDLVRQVLQACPKGIPVTVVAIGSQRAFPMQATLVNALRGAGYDVSEDSVGMMVPPPEGPLSIHHNAVRTTVLVAPSA